MDWRKSSRSGSATNCVELRQDLAAIRDSKHPVTPLHLSRQAIRELVARNR